jgi:glutamine phosphoribosylpyrophosphate amidotransferase
MCELLAAASADPFPMGDLWDLAAGLERYGLAGFGWGAVWLTAEATFAHHLDTGAFRDDPARSALADVRTTAVMVHLRRPSKLSTIGLPDAQPFLDPAGRFAFSHNGDLAAFREVRPGYAAQGRIAGRADSEVGQRWLEDRWPVTAPSAARGTPDPCGALAALHAELGGQANLMALTPAGVTHVHAGNTENPVFRFRLGRIGVVSTALYSIDRSLFRLVARDATDRHLLRPGQRFDLAPGA